MQDSLLLSREKQKRVVAEGELAATKQQLGLTVAALDRARKVNPEKLKAGRPTPRLAGDIVRVCIPDTHGAHADKEALSAALGDIAALQPHEIILLGDHVDCGGFLAQHHVMGYVAETDYSYEQDIAATNAFLDALRRAAPNAKIEYIEGNHERRVETWCVTQVLRHRQDAEFLRRAFAPEFLLKLKEREIPYYRQGECYGNITVPGVIKRGKCFYFHGFSTAKHAVASTQARVGGNCVFAHTHRAQADITRPMGAGTIGAWNPGCLCRLQPLWNHTRPSDWPLGYAAQLIARTQNFLHLNVPIISGKSLLTALFKR